MFLLKKLEIERDWRDNTKHTGSVKFDGEAGEVSLALTPELCHRLFLLCADAIIATARDAASSLVCEAQATLAQTPAAKIGG